VTLWGACIVAGRALLAVGLVALGSLAVWVLLRWLLGQGQAD
jgi:uncharacterized membrane protein